MRRMLIATGAAFMFLVLAARADAQTFLTGSTGFTSGGDAPAQKLSFSGRLTMMGRVAGVEGDFGYTPDFFAQQTSVALIAKSNVTTLMGNLLIGVGGGPIRPYLTVGTGLLRTHVSSASGFFGDLSANNWGFDAGVSVMGLFSKRWGVEADARYFRSLQDPTRDSTVDLSLGTFDFWRITGGLTYRF